MRRRHRAAARGHARRRLGDRPDVRGDKWKPRFASVVLVVAERHEVRIVAQLRVVGDDRAGRARVPAPPVRQVARVGRLGPAEQQVVVGEVPVERDRAVEPAIAQWIPLDLRVARIEPGRHGGEGCEVGRAQLAQVGLVIDPHEVVHEFQVASGADRAGGVGRRRLISLVGGRQAGAVQPVVEGCGRRHGRRRRGGEVLGLGPCFRSPQRCWILGSKWRRPVVGRLAVGLGRDEHRLDGADGCDDVGSGGSSLGGEGCSERDKAGDSQGCQTEYPQGAAHTGPPGGWSAT